MACLANPTSIFQPKVVYYKSNGSGRDTYVTMNDQGLTCSKPLSFVTEGFPRKSPARLYNPISQ